LSVLTLRPTVALRRQAVVVVAVVSSVL
jgi:hypothetical protein